MAASTDVVAYKGEVFDDVSKRMKELILSTVAKGLNEDELKLFLYQCRRLQLDPLCKQIYAIKRNGQLTFQLSIDGMRAQALRSGLYMGREPVQWCNRDGVWTDVWLDRTCPPFAAKVGVKVSDGKGSHYVVWAVATTASYSAATPLWSKMPDVMIAKCAEANAIRAAFPMNLSGLYSPEEMDQAAK